MRRIVGIVLIGLGVALLTLAVTLRAYVYPAVATVELTQNSKTVSAGSGVQVLVVRKAEDGGIRPITDDVTYERVTIGDPDRSADGKAFWETTSTGRAASITDGPLSVSVEGVCFDRFTAAATSGCRGKDYLATASGVPPTFIAHEGLFFKFPFDAQKRSYPFWDGNLKKPADAVFSNEEDIEGLRVYKYEQRIPTTTVGTQSNLPGSLFDSSEPVVTADIVYSNTRTLWIEPVTGVIIRGQEQQDRRFSYDGVDVPATVGTIGYTSETVSSAVATYKEKASDLRKVRSTYPLLAGVLGAVSLLAGIGLLVLAARGRGPGGSSQGPAHRKPDPVNV